MRTKGAGGQSGPSGAGGQIGLTLVWRRSSRTRQGSGWTAGAGPGSVSGTRQPPGSRSRVRILVLKVRVACRVSQGYGFNNGATWPVPDLIGRGGKLAGAELLQGQEDQEGLGSHDRPWEEAGLVGAN